MNRYRVSAAVASVVTVIGIVAGGAPASAQPPAGTRVDLRVLVVSDGGPSTEAIAAELAAEGVPFTQVDLTDPDRPTLDAAFLADVVEQDGTSVDRARYQAVVLPNANPFSNPAEFLALANYERQYGIRQVNASVAPTGAVGLGSPAYSGSLDGVTATLTPAGTGGPFDYLRGAVPFEDIDPAVAESWGSLAQPITADLVPLLTATAPASAASGVLVSELTVDGRSQLSITFSYHSAQQQFQLLAPGIVSWATAGVHLGLYRNYLAVNVDDVFLPDARWSITGNCTPGEDCTGGQTTPDIRMTAADVTTAAAWQAERDFTFDLMFNGIGSMEAAAETPGGQDPLTTAFLAQRDEFRWTNHTLTHEFLGCLRDASVTPWRCETDPVTGDIRYASQALIEEEIAVNIAWATAYGLPIDPTELVTGEHSGLPILPQQPVVNPNLAPALEATGIRWLAADNSRMSTQLRVGPAYTVPRHPLNVFFNVATVAEEVDEYNWIYTSRANGGSGICEDHPETVTCISPLDPSTGFAGQIIPLETRLALARILGNDPRPHFVHQSNLTEDRLIYPVLDSILTEYRALLADNTPIVNERLAANGEALRRQVAWSDALADGEVTAYLLDGTVTATAPAGVQVPLTVPEGARVGDGSGAIFGESYAGQRSGYAAMAEGANLTVVLP